MDQYDGGNGGGYPPQGGAVPPQQDGYALQQGGYVPPQQPRAPQVAYAPPKKKKLWLWIGGAAVIVIAVALVLVFTLGKGGAAESLANPMLYVEDGDVYLAVGAESILLEDAAFVSGNEVSLAAWVMPDSSALFYLAGVGSSGEGDLMRIVLGNAKAEPERVAEDVYTARISADGKKILYISDCEGDAGDLYLCSPGGDPKQIDESVWSEQFGFSPNGKLFYYIRKDGGQTLMLYAGREAEEVSDIEESWVNRVYLDDSGRILFDTHDLGEGEFVLYLYADGEVERVNRDARYAVAFGRADEFLYFTGDSEMYYVAGGDETRVSDEFYGLYFPTRTTADPRVGYEKHFVFCEGESYDELTLYEISLPGDPVKIGRESGGFDFDKNFRYCAYESDGTLYLTQKEGNSWGKREEICDSPRDFNIDDEGRYLYYIACDEGETSGDFCRVPLSGGEEEVLLEDVTQFLLWEGSVYAVNDEDEAYVVRSERDSERIEKNISYLCKAEGGIYLSGNDGELYFYGGGEAERLSQGATIVYTYSYIASAVD